jgi:hypothetical protein
MCAMLDIAPVGWARSRARSALHLVMLVAGTSLVTASVLAVVCFTVFRVLTTAH